MHTFSFTVLMLEEPTGRHNWRILLGVGVKLGMEIICNHNIYDKAPSQTLALYIALVAAALDISPTNLYIDYDNCIID